LSKEKNIESMGRELGEAFYEIWQETARLHSKWTEYKDLYDHNEEQIDLLNNTASSFFRIVQDMFWESVMLQLCRLTDPAKSAGKRNLSIQSLSTLVDNSIKTELDCVIQSAVESTSFCRDWRNRRIAHRDLDLSTGKECVPLETVNTKKVDAAITEIVLTVNYVHKYYEDTTTLFRVGSLLGGAKCLIYKLENPNDSIT
jgi:hypothetical protein